MSGNYISAPLQDTATNGVGLGYGIAIAVGLLVLVSTIMLASYVCVRVKGGSPAESRLANSATTTTAPDAGFVVAVGLDRLTIESYPKFVYGAGNHGPFGEPVAGPCPICLAEYRVSELLRCMPECGHCLHAGCLDEWLRLSASCPLCRNSPVPSAASTPAATPLSELIPLAVHAR